MRWSLACVFALAVGGVVVTQADGPQGQPDESGVVFCVAEEADDGTEVNEKSWHVDGYQASGLNRMGRNGATRYAVGLRFDVPAIEQGETFVYARLVLAGTGDGQVDTAAQLQIVGIDADGISEFAVLTPALLPKTVAKVSWEIDENWPVSDRESLYAVPLLRASPDISPVINEIVSRSAWGEGIHGHTLGLAIQNTATESVNYVTIEDADDQRATTGVGTTAPRLELYRDIRSTFLATEMLGRPTHRSMTVNALSLLTLEVYAEYGKTPGVYTSQTSLVTCPGGEPFEIVLNNLAASTTYYYRLCYRRPGAAIYEAGPQGQFTTRRLAGSSFRFTVASDAHIWEVERQGVSPLLYRRTLDLVLADHPDFHFDLGDSAMCEDYSMGDVRDEQDALYRYLTHRKYLDAVCHSVPFFLVLGNHEGEQGWRFDGAPENVAVWSTRARKRLFPNPIPNSFYTGCQVGCEWAGLPENYYAFAWGDALFVVLDPYRYTTTKPHGAGGTPGSDDNWDWTLGHEQYDWLCETLATSTAKFKFVFAHQVVGGATTYGRGGIEAARHSLGGFGSYEWGGEDITGRQIFNRKRPGWGRPIHDVLVENGVTIFFHGHDHVFVKQDLDGVVYQECPQASDALYMSGHFPYAYGTKFPNAGYVRVSVFPSQVKVDYVRSFLPGDGIHGKVQYTYTILMRHN